MFIEYYCVDCDVKDLETKIVILKKCPKCGYYMLANEWDFDN